MAPTMPYETKVDRTSFLNKAWRNRCHTKREVKPMTAETLEPRPIPTLRRDDRGLPFVGQLLEYAKDPVGLYRRHYERYGPVAPFRSVGRNAAVLLGPDACETAQQQ